MEWGCGALYYAVRPQVNIYFISAPALFPQPPTSVCEMATLKVKDYLEDGQINNGRLNTLTDCGWRRDTIAVTLAVCIMYHGLYPRAPL